MTFNLRAAVGLACLSVLAACGGGGGGGGTSDTTQTTTGGVPAVMVITEANAKPVAGSALHSAQNITAATGSSSLATGVQVEEQAQVGLPWLAESARVLASLARPGPALATGVDINQTENCTFGGTLTISGHVAGQTAFAAGDSLAMSASGCRMQVNGVTTTINGDLSMTVQSGSVTSSTFHAVLAMSVNNFSISSGNTTVVASGDIRLDWTRPGNGDRLVATGSVLTNRTTQGTITRTTTWKNYTQTITNGGFTISAALDAQVETESNRPGASNGSYQLRTLTPLQWIPSSQNITAGSFKIVGASGSQLLLTVTTQNQFRIEIDANGDGVYEKTSTASDFELRMLF